MKRGQAEIIGLLLIVVLLAVGFLLYIKFSLTSTSGSHYEDYRATQMGQSFLNSLVFTSVECGCIEYSVQELVRDIASGNTRCGNGGEEDALNATLTKILGATLDPWGINYRLVIVKKRGDRYERIGIPDYTNHQYPAIEQCNVTMPHSMDYQLVPLNPGTAEIDLYQC